jgi:hypothetical protein
LQNEPSTRLPAPDRMSSVAPNVLRVLVTLLAAVATVSQVAYLDALSWHVLGLAMAMSTPMSMALVAVMTGHAVVSFVAGVLAVVLVLHEGPRQAAARGLGVALGAWSYLTAYSGVTLLLRPDLVAWRSLFEGHFLVVEVIGLVGLLRFTALFPNPLASARLELPPTLPPAMKPLHAASVWILRPWAPWAAGAGVLLILWTLTSASGIPLGDAGLSPLMDLVRFIAAGLVVVNLRRSWGRADRADAGRMTWLLVALAFLTGSLLLLIGANVWMAVTGWPEPDVAGFSLRAGVGTLLAFVVIVAMHRGMVRSLERLFAQMPGLERA